MTKTKPLYLSAQDVAARLEVSKASAYRKIRTLNEELAAKGYLVVPGKIPRRFFEERVYQ